LLTLAKQLRNLSSGNLRTLTVPLSNPNGRHPTVGSVVIWDSVLAPELWSRIDKDEPLIDTIKPTKKASSTSQSGSTSKPVTVDKFKSKTGADNPCAPKA
jgi:hypothetical protein